MDAGAKKPKYNGQLDCYKKIFAEFGYRGFFNGALANVFRGVGASLVLVMFDDMQKYLAPMLFGHWLLFLFKLFSPIF